MDTPRYKKMLVLGATGKTGKELIDIALARGHEVTAFVRSPAKIARRDNRLTVVKGDPRSVEELCKVLVGHALGAGTNAKGGDDAQHAASGVRIECHDCDEAHRRAPVPGCFVRDAVPGRRASTRVSPLPAPTSRARPESDGRQDQGGRGRMDDRAASPAHSGNRRELSRAVRW